MKEKIFYEMVRTLAHRQNKNIDVVIKDAGLKPSSYYSYRKKGNLPRADIAVKIARILGCSVEQLVTGNKPVFSEFSVQEKKDMYQLLDELEKTIKLKKEKFK